MVDCQATAAAPRGHLLEIGWAQVRNTVTHPHACLIALPEGEEIPPAVSRITGISEHMMRASVDRQLAWRALCYQAASLTQQPAPTVIHFARFEQPFLRTLAAGLFPLDVVCTRDIARRLLPNLPRCSLRALAGYFGRAAAQRRPRRSDGVRLARTGPRARDEGRVHVERAPRLARRTRRADPLATARLADAARRAAFAAGCAWHLSHASDGWQRPVRRQGSFAASSGQQLFSETERRARAVARDAFAGTRDLVRRLTQSARGGAPRAGRNQATPTALTTSRSRFRTAPCGSRHRISARVVHSHRHTARSGLSHRPRRSINLGHSLGRRALH